MTYVFKDVSITVICWRKVQLARDYRKQTRYEQISFSGLTIPISLWTLLIALCDSVGVCGAAVLAGVTSSSRALLKHRQAARCLQPSRSYVRVCFDFSLIIALHRSKSFTPVKSHCDPVPTNPSKGPLLAYTVPPSLHFVSLVSSSRTDAITPSSAQIAQRCGQPRSALPLREYDAAQLSWNRFNAD